MADFDDLYGTKFLSATELKGPVTAVIESMTEESFIRPGERPQRKMVAHCKGAKKGLVINKTNALTLATAYGRDMQAWIGKRITVKAEPTTFGGRPTLGLRVYPAEAPALEASKPTGSFELNDEIPW
jgi:hypothetical protein